MTPDGKTIIVMEYAQYTWRLPVPSTKRQTKSTTLIVDSDSSFIDPGNSFYMLHDIDNVDDEGYMPDYLNQDRMEGHF